MPFAERSSAITTLQNAATGASAGVTVPIAAIESVVVEVSGTYTNLEATFEVSIDGGTTFWPVTLVMVSSGGGNAPKMTTPGLYAVQYARAATHFRAPITTSGAPTGAMTIKAVGVWQ